MEILTKTIHLWSLYSQCLLHIICSLVHVSYMLACILCIVIVHYSLHYCTQTNLNYRTLSVYFCNLQITNWESCTSIIWRFITSPNITNAYFWHIAWTHNYFLERISMVAYTSILWVCSSSKHDRRGPGQPNFTNFWLKYLDTLYCHFSPPGN